MKLHLATLLKGGNTMIFKRMTIALAAFTILAQLTFLAMPAAAGRSGNTSPPPLPVRGYAVSISEDGNIAVVGTDIGWAYVYYRSNNGWLKKATLSGGSASVADHFGHSVAISGDGRTIVVGAPYAGGGDGDAYVFTVDYSSGVPVWSNQELSTKRLSPFAPQFGSSVAINQNGDTIVIGANPDSAVDIGSAYVFKCSNGSWSQLAELTDPGLSGGDMFGGSVAINRSGTGIMIGAWNNNHSTDSDGMTPKQDGVGAVYLFKYDSASDSWSQSQKIAGLSSGDNFGSSLGFNSCNIGNNSQNQVIIGAPGRNNSQGAAYYYTYDGSNWSFAHEITAPSPAAGDEFGYSVALQGNIIGGSSPYYRLEALIGAPNKNSSRGAAYVYTFSDSTPYWMLFSSYAPSAAKGVSTVTFLFGASVAINGDGNTVVVGAPTQNTGQGSTYVYDYSSHLFVINSVTLPTGRVGIDYSGGPITTKNGYGTYAWKWSGKVPPGLYLNPQGDGSSAVISGRPTLAGKFNFTVSVTDAVQVISRSFSITITK